MPVWWETLTRSYLASTWGKSSVTLHWGCPRAWRKPFQRQLATSSPHPHPEICLMNSGDMTSHRHYAPCSRWVNLLPKPHAVSASCVGHSVHAAHTAGSCMGGPNELWMPPTTGVAALSQIREGTCRQSTGDSRVSQLLLWIPNLPLLYLAIVVIQQECIRVGY